MKARHAVLAALAAAVAATSIAAAGPHAAKQRVAITMMGLPSGTFVLTPLRNGAVKRDSGSVTFGAPPNYNSRSVIRDGQKADVYPPVVWKLEGKLGTLTIREPANAWVDAGSDLGGPAIATGTWKVIRGTGQYARIAGGGRTAHAGLDGGGSWYAHQEGFLTHP
jgi:hypothetical protein